MGHQSEYFSSSYQEARSRFLKAASHAGFTVASYQHPLPGYDGQAIFTDIASKIPGNAKHIVMTTSGIHGVEGFAGSAAQIQALKTADKPNDVGIIHVHALNPHGFDFGRRVNEHNIDLSRNFIDWSAPLPEDHSLNAAVQSTLKTKPGLWQQARIALLMARHGMGTAKDALTRGQYSDPSGLYFGGTGPAWSNLLWHQIVARVTAQTPHLTHIDFHTGLGPYGKGEMIMMADRHSPMFHRAESLWDNVTTPQDGSSSTSLITGSMCNAFNRTAARRIIVTTGALEFGTLPPLDVLKALATDHHAYLTMPAAEARKVAWQAMQNAFNPPDSIWQVVILDQSQRALHRALMLKP
jgi:hypothetical protein